MEFPYKPNMAAEAGEHFDRVVELILKKEYGIRKPPEPKVCRECDLRIYCAREGIIKIKRGSDHK